MSNSNLTISNIIQLRKLRWKNRTANDLFRPTNLAKLNDDIVSKSKFKKYHVNL